MDDEQQNRDPDHDDSRAAERPSQGADEGHSPGGGEGDAADEPGPMGNPDVDEEAQSQGQQDS